MSLAIPIWHGFGMNSQITVRIPEELVAFIDAEVARGKASSRADAVTRALLRERRRQAALADVAILRGSGGGLGNPDLDGLADHAAAHPVDLDD